MNSISRLLFVALIIASFQSFGQIKGETDAVSVPDLQPVDPPGNARTMSIDDYNAGYAEGYQKGYEEGLYDANTCSKNQSFWYLINFLDENGNLVYSVDYEDGHYNGWHDAYSEAYQERIAEKAAACPVDYEFDDFFCECQCISREYYYDGDGDNYYDFSRSYIYVCNRPNSSWKLLDDLYGIDCDDTNASVWRYNECGLCTSTSGITTWYYFNDNDNYYGQTKESCSKPTTGDPTKWRSNPGSGEDCDDNDDLANINQTWYYFNDEDTYYGDTRQSCLRPTDLEWSKWKTDPGSGEDCNDNDSDVFGPITWYYDDDRDGYHGISQVSCLKPTTGEVDKWVKVTNGEDCDDNNNNLHTLNFCGECGKGELNKAYVDFDGDGYHSIELNDISIFRNGTGNSTWDNYENSLAPCADIPLYIRVEYLFEQSFFTENILPLPVLQLFPEDPYDDYTSEEIAPHISPDNLCQIIENYPPTGGDPWSSRLTNDPRFSYPFSDYIELPHGGILWIEHYGSYDPESWKGPEWYIRSHRVLFSAEWKGINYISESSLGEDCDDFNSSIKANGDWYYDNDGDGYYDPNIAPIVGTCTPNDSKRILLENSFGPDCDDTDPEAKLLITWYYDGDDDNYYGVTQQSCENPEKGTANEYKWTISEGSGQDCDDTDPHAGDETKLWYRDLDGDNYYGYTLESCKNPALGTEEEQKWKTDPGSGADCNDADPDNSELNACGVCGGSDDPVNFYVDLDGDGYHSVQKFEDCGLNAFDGTLVRGSAFPESLLPEGDDEYITIPNTTYQIHYVGGETDIFYFPEEVLTYASPGLDCDDLDPDVLADGQWYPDVDRDGYHDPAAIPVNSCSPPDPQTYILLDNSKGKDCDDTDAAINKLYTWYLDADGDGYYVDIQKSCAPPGLDWSTISGIGFDSDDNDPFTPALQPVSFSEDFIIPSLLKPGSDDEGNDVITYGGSTYAPEEITIYYHGITFHFEDLVFDRVDPRVRLLPNKLVIGYGAPLYGGEVIVEETSAASSTARTAITEDEQGKRGSNVWMDELIQGNDGYSNIRGSVVLDPLNSGYFDELFDPAKFDAFKAHYAAHGGPEFAVQIKTYVEELVEETNGPEHALQIPRDKLITDEKIGEGEPKVIITARKTLLNTVEYVIFIHDDSFKATDEELHQVGWKDASGNWINPGDEELYNLQLAEISHFRNMMIGILADEYDNVVENKPVPPAADGLPDEVYPDYNFGQWGVLTKWMEFLEVGHHLGHNFEMPEGTWDPAAADNGWDRWRTKSPSSIAGVVDGSLVEIKDMAEMVKLAQSLCHKSTWVQLLESLKDFNIGEQIKSMMSSYEDEISVLQGDQGEYKQYHGIGEVTVRTLATIYAGWKLAGKLAKKIARPKSNNPKAAFDQRKRDFETNFRDAINKTPEFDGLSKELQEKLIKDVAESSDELAEAIAKDSKLIGSWRQIEEAAKRANPTGDAGKILRKDLASLKAIAKFDNGLITKIGQARFDNFMEKLLKANPKCKSCGNSGTSLVGNLDEVMDDFHEVVTKRVSNPDGSFISSFDDFMVEAGEQASKAKAASFTLKKMSKSWDDLRAGGWELKNFEGNIPDIETRHRLDLKFERIVDGVPQTKLIEMKNWRAARNISLNTYEQFKAYITSGHRFEYHFNNGISASMKNNFQNVFKDVAKVDELWEVGKDFFKRNDIRTKSALKQLANDGALINHKLLDFVH